MSTRVAIYARVSHEYQDIEGKTSIENQLEQCIEYANRNNWQIVGQFVDNRDYLPTIRPYTSKKRLVNCSGSRVDRPQLQAMLKLVTQGEIDVILCWRDDRLYRHERVVTALNEAIEESPNEVEIHQCSGEISRDFMYLQAMIWRKENEARKHRSVAGKIKTVQAGCWPGAWRLYGYTLEKTKHGTSQ